MIFRNLGKSQSSPYYELHLQSFMRYYSETFTKAVPAIEYWESRINYSKLRFGESRRNQVWELRHKHWESRRGQREWRSILDRILDSYKDWESSVNFLLNSTVFWKKVALSLRKLGGAEQETISRIQWPSWITLSSKRCSEMSRGGKQIIQLYTHKTYRFSLDHD